MLIYSKYYLAKKYDLEGNKHSIFWKEELKELKLRYTSLQTPIINERVSILVSTEKKST